MEKKQSQIVSLQLPVELIEQLKTFAEINYMSFSAYTRKLLIEGIKNEGKNLNQ